MCSIGARVSANGLELAIHDKSIDEAKSGMLKGSRETPDDFEAE
jgi:hypothetical protein